ncbi:MAG: GNAT family N-acetyltransferase, partial [Hyphomicrobiaceae bacterium]
AVLPATWSKGNPVDIIGDANEVRYRNAMDILLEDPAVDAVLVINCPTAVASSLESAKAVVEATREKKSRGGSLKPVFACWLGDGSARPSRQLFAESAIASFETPENAIEGFVQLVRHRRAQDELLLTPPSLGSGFRVDRKRASGIIKGALAAGRKMLSEDEAKSVLAAYDVPVVATTLARSADEVADAATMILTAGSSAAVIKIVADGVSHKSDVGGVRLGILSGEEARQAAQDMLQRIARLRPGAQVRGFTVQPMIKRSGAHELIVGMSVDPTFGPMMLFGAGGTSVEVEADTSLSLPPLDLKLARQLIRRTRISRLLAGYRDRPAADIAAIELTLVKVSQLIADHPEIRELDINPLLADEQGAIALDARIGVEDAKAHPRAAMALRPYPVEWERHDQIEGIGDVELRPIRPDDEHLYEEFFRHVTQEDARMRFFSPVKGLAHKYLARLTQIDYAREMAFVAIDTNGKLLGVARFIADPDYTSGEYGVIVRSDLKGRGLGWHLMQHLIAYARSEGLQELYGDVLAENVTMLQMCSELGFEISAIADDLTVRRVRLHLPGGGHRNS